MKKDTLLQEVVYIYIHVCTSMSCMINRMNVCAHWLCRLCVQGTDDIHTDGGTLLSHINRYRC